MLMTNQPQIRAFHPETTAFISRWAQELRTQLNVVSGFAKLLEIDPVLGPAQLDNVREILRTTQGLQDLIDQVSALTRIDSGQNPIHLEPVDIFQLVAECLDQVSATAAACGVSLDNRINQTRTYRVKADQHSLRLALINLLTNAIHSNTARGEIRIDGNGLGNRVRIVAADTGQRLAAKKRALGLASFHKPPSMQCHDVGLWVACRLIMLMGGQIGLDSRTEDEVCFWLELNLV